MPTSIGLKNPGEDSILLLPLFVPLQSIYYHFIYCRRHLVAFSFCLHFQFSNGTPQSASDLCFVWIECFFCLSIPLPKSSYIPFPSFPPIFPRMFCMKPPDGQMASLSPIGPFSLLDSSNPPPPLTFSIMSPPPSTQYPILGILAILFHPPNSQLINFIKIMAKRKFSPPVLLFSLAFLLISMELVKAPFSRNGTQAVDRKVTFKEIIESKEEENAEKESHENEEENLSVRGKSGSEEKNERKMAESHGREKTIKTKENVEEDPLIAIARRDVKEIMGQFGDEAKEIGLQNGMEYVLALFDGHFHFWCPNLEERPKKEIPYKNWQKNCNKWKSLWKPFKNWIQLLAIVEAEQPLDLDVNLMYLTVRPMLRKASKSGENEEDENLVVETIKAFIEIRTIKEGEKGEKKGGFTEREPPEWENQKEFEMVDGWAEYCKRQYYQNEKYGRGEIGRFKEAKARLRIWLEKDEEMLAGKKLMGGKGDARFGGNGANGSRRALSADDPRFYGRPHYAPRPNYSYPRSHYPLADHRQRPPHPAAEYRPPRPSHLYGNIPSDIQRRFRQQTYYSPADDHFKQNNAPPYPETRKLPTNHFWGRKGHPAIYRGGWSAFEESANHALSMHMTNGSRQLY